MPVADWTREKRREGRAVLFVHHDGKNGRQRGSSRRKDVLDVVVGRSRPADYRESKAARSVLTLNKARELTGQDIDAIEAGLGVDASGAQKGPGSGPRRRTSFPQG